MCLYCGGINNIRKYAHIYFMIAYLANINVALCTHGLP